MTSTRVHAVSDDALGEHDAVALAALVRRREVSPAELAAAAVARARQVEPELNALVLERFDEAMATADRLPEGPLRGVPTFIKDMSDLTGYPTRWGSDALSAAAPADHDAPEVAQLLAMGTNVLGKTSMPDFGIICSAEYPDAAPTRNPWNTGHTPGGSSSGAAAMVAAGVVPLAHAADGGGSIRIPAAACGLVGMKATRGRIAEEPTTKVLPVRVTSHGVVTRTVRDSWAYLAAAEQQFRPRSLQPIGPVGAPLSSTLRIGYITGTSNGAVIDSATLRVQDETVALLESLGHQVEHVSNPISASLADDFILYYGFLTLMIATGGRQLFDPSFDRAALTPVVRGFGDHCRANLGQAPGGHPAPAPFDRRGLCAVRAQRRARHPDRRAGLTRHRTLRHRVALRGAVAEGRRVGLLHAVEQRHRAPCGLAADGPRRGDRVADRHDVPRGRRT